ncbi:MAG: RluA family pseudouridine synthase [Lachnospiraceae bacterium]|jgi:23S rRNA pseudouridine955/2504/2580 synthase|nr:RluA family pseudouridine synthase [Lachnospiraceae bacterium]
MKVMTINSNQDGQRLDNFLLKLFPEATKSFLYKMLRKKNITLNDAKAEGNERLRESDEVKIFFSDETFLKFSVSEREDTEFQKLLTQANEAYRTFRKIPVVYEDDHVLIVDKPNGILSQKAEPTDLSLNEWLIGYLLVHNALKEEDLHSFHPSICNRLDRNTTGLVLCGKTLPGSREIGNLVRDKSLSKYYRAIVDKVISSPQELKGYLVKDDRNNRVKVYQTVEELGYLRGSRIHTTYRPITSGTEITYLEIRLHTGKTHQIRAHLSSIGHPIIGDYKYGNRTRNEVFRQKFGVRDQLLCAYRLEFPKLEGILEPLSEKVITASIPENFEKVLHNH